MRTLSDGRALSLINVRKALGMSAWLWDITDGVTFLI